MNSYDTSHSPFLVLTLKIVIRAGVEPQDNAIDTISIIVLLVIAILFLLAITGLPVGIRITESVFMAAVHMALIFMLFSLLLRDQTETDW